MRTRKSVLLGLIALAAGFLGGAAKAQQASSSSAVTYFDHEKVDAGFAKNGALFEGKSGGGSFKVLTARRDRAGEVEIHNLDTDVIYVLSGTATFITGGNPVAAKPTTPGEVRAQSIQGGDAHGLSQGDVIVVPHGVPHWFKEVQAPFLYFVVKVH